MPTELRFGFYPKNLDFAAGDVTISTLDALEVKIKDVTESGRVEHGWYYSPPAAVKDIMSGVMRTLPYNGRVFRMPKTHALYHATSTDPEHLSFLVWVLGFVLGIRLSETEAGFLDATPIDPGTLHDIVWLSESESRALAIADTFWRLNSSNSRIPKGVAGIIHSLFLSQMPTLLDFEKFTYLYIALDGCHFVWSAMNGQRPTIVRHSDRIANLCSAFQCTIPDWADAKTGTVASYRNETLHEGLFFDEPLGFRIYRDSSSVSESASQRNVLLEMKYLVCRLLCGLVGFNDYGYIRSAINTRQQQGVRL